MVNDEIVSTLKENCLELECELGLGGYATVYKVRHTGCRQVYAVKIIDSASVSDEHRLASYMNEIHSLSNIYHPNIISIYNHFQSEHYLYILLEYCAKGSLVDKIERDGPYKGNEYQSISLKILNAIAYLHKNNISHGDIKPANILFDEYWRPKLGDFGLAELRNNPDELKTNYSCSPAYASPEQLLHIPYDPFKADMWSFGVTCFYLSSGKLPFTGRNIKDLLMKGPLFDILDDSNVILENILMWTLAMKPQDRISAESLLNKKIFEPKAKKMHVNKSMDYLGNIEESHLPKLIKHGSMSNFMVSEPHLLSKTSKRVNGITIKTPTTAPSLLSFRIPSSKLYT